MKIIFNARKVLGLIKEQLREHYINYSELIDEACLKTAIATVTKINPRFYIRELTEEKWLVLNIAETQTEGNRVFIIKPVWELGS